MKSLTDLNNVERAKLLFELHPHQIKGFVEYSKGLLTRQLSDTTELKANWNNGMITYEYWISLLESIRGVIVKYDTQLSQSKNIFADQLFDGYLAFVSTTLLANYKKECKNDKFNQTIDLLFT